MPLALPELRVVTSSSPALDSLEQKLAIVRTRVAGVWDRTWPGFYIYGPPGTGKTHTVLETLNGFVADDPNSSNYVYHRGHLTPMGLFELLAENDDQIIVIDDCHLLFEQKLSQQLLLAALGNSVYGARVVKYKRQGRNEKVLFRGGLICISNLDLRSGSDRTDPLLEAVSSRAHVVRYEPTNREMEALILHLASAG